jgi:hypothetical protein
MRQSGVVNDPIMVKVYDLRDDSKYVRQVQEATLTRAGFGLQPIPALFGSPEWWSALDSAALPLHRVTGTISNVYWGSMGDWPEFKLRNDDGAETTWTRQGDHTRYVEGLRGEAHYVMQLFKEDFHSAQQGRSLEHPVVVAVFVEESDLRSAPIGPGPGGGQYRL